MADKKPSFAERIERMKLAVQTLRIVADTIDLEAEEMIAAQKRFAERNGQKRERRART